MSMPGVLTWLNLPMHSYMSLIGCDPTKIVHHEQFCMWSSQGTVLFVAQCEAQSLEEVTAVVKLCNWVEGYFGSSLSIRELPWSKDVHCNTKMSVHDCNVSIHVQNIHAKAPKYC